MALPKAQVIEIAARTSHEANRAYCQTLGDYSQPPWDEAPDWQKESARMGAASVLEGRAKSPEEQHQQWMDHKANEGWVYGPVKDPAKKEHPCMVPYDQLPPEQQVKDHLFRASVQAAAFLL